MHNRDEIARVYQTATHMYSCRAYYILQRHYLLLVTINYDLRLPFINFVSVSTPVSSTTLRVKHPHDETTIGFTP